MPACNSCHAPFPDFAELALHISHSKKGHRKGKLWAARYLMRVRALDSKVSADNRPERSPMTAEQKETKRSLIREISGVFHSVLCVCPQCKKGHTASIEVEYLESETAWKSLAGKPMVLCGNCRYKN